MKIMKKLIVILLITTSIFASSIRDKTYGSIEVSEVTSIYDGDTFRVNIDSYPGIVGYHIPVRVNGIDTPEIRGKCYKEKQLARDAKKFTVSFLRKAKKIELRNIKRGKYFRILADVYIDNVSLAEELMKNDYAVEYNGGTKIDWCRE